MIKTIAAKTLIFLLLVFTAMVLSGAFGVLHDQISYSISPEYFTLFKFPQFGIPEEISPRLGAAFVGFLASWWMGIPIGFVLTTTGAFAPTPHLMLRRTLAAYLVVAIITIFVGILGLMVGIVVIAEGGLIKDRGGAEFFLGWHIPKQVQNQRAFLRVGFMHEATYLGGAIGLLIALIRQAFTVRTLPNENSSK